MRLEHLIRDAKAVSAYRFLQVHGATDELRRHGHTDLLQKLVLQGLLLKT